MARCAQVATCILWSSGGTGQLPPCTASPPSPPLPLPSPGEVMLPPLPPPPPLPLRPSAVGNVALGRTASQSSTNSDNSGQLAAANAVDGYTDCSSGPGRLAITFADSPSWWIVDLGDVFQVANVSVYGRDCCVPLTSGNVIQSNHLEIRVGNTSAAGGQTNALCASQVSAPAVGVNVPCSGIAGRFVSVLKTGYDGAYADYMSLCEVQVWATASSSVPSPPPPQPPPPSPQLSFACTQQDNVCNALGDLYGATNGASWTYNGGWATARAGTPTSYCSFYGITCNDSGVITQMCVPGGAQPLHFAALRRLAARSLPLRAADLSIPTSSTAPCLPVSAA